MARVKKPAGELLRRRPPARSLEARENQMISYAMDLAEKRLIEGTATSQEVTHFLKLGTTLALLEKEKLRNENALTKAKIDALESQKRSEALYQDALDAMKRYSGKEQDDEEL